MTEHRLDRIDFRRPARFVAVCTCGWHSEPMVSAGLAGALWDRHVEQLPSEQPKDAPVLDVDLDPGRGLTSRQRATVIVGSVELGERDRIQLRRLSPSAGAASCTARG